MWENIGGQNRGKTHIKIKETRKNIIYAQILRSSSLKI